MTYTPPGPASQDKAVSHEFGHQGQLGHPRTSHSVSDVQGLPDPTVSLIIPWRGGDERREQLWDWCKRYWVSHYPEFELIESDNGEEPFSRGNSRNEGVEKSSGDILVFADADTLIGHVDEAVSIAQRGDWCLAYQPGAYCALSEEATDVLLKTDPTGQLREPTNDQCRARITSYGGVQAMPRVAFETVEGYDPRFRGYGGEDLAIMFALDTLWKPHIRASGWATHLFHPHIDEERFKQPLWPANDALCKRYEGCYGNPSAMRQLIAER